MFSAFKTRRPWAAAAINLIFDPFVGMLYLNRGPIALAYLGLEFATVAAAIAIFSPVILLLASGATLLLASIPFRLVGAVHAYFLARARLRDQPMRWYSRWYALALITLTFPVTALVIRTFLFQPFDLPGGSMSPTLNIGDHVWVRKFAYILSQPQRGDVIVFKTAQGDDFVKRVTGLPGDRIQLVAGRVYVNGNPARLQRIPDLWLDCDEFGSCTRVPQFFEWLPGGSRHRILQASTNGDMDNTAAVTVPPDSYYVLGDNRDNSNDSRLDLGFVPARNILGQVVVKFIDGRIHRVVWQSVN